MSETPIRIEIEIIEAKVDDFRKLIKSLSDSRVRDVLFEYPEECKSILKQLFSCLPSDTKYETLQSKLLGDAEKYKILGEAIVPHIMIYIEKQKIKIKDENYYKNFLPFVSRYKAMEGYYGNNFKNCFIKSIYNFNCFVAPKNSNYKLQKLTGYICMFLQILEDELSDKELVDKVKNTMKTTSSVDLYQDQLSKQPHLKEIQVLDSTDPFLYNTFLKKVI